MLAALRRNRSLLLDRIAAACERAGRRADGVRLVAVTKSVAPEVAGALVEIGSRDLGESRLPELERKHAWFAERGLEAHWHFIGHLQRNKARRVVRLADAIHSVDSLALIETLDRVAAEEDRRPQIYLQVKVADEQAKFGLLPEELHGAIECAAQQPHLRLAGLMAMAPLVADGTASAEAARSAFATLADLASRYGPAAASQELFGSGGPLLSMGMSSDFEIAIEEGAQLVRIGTALYEGLPPELRGAPAGHGGGP